MDQDRTGVGPGIGPRIGPRIGPFREAVRNNRLLGDSSRKRVMGSP